MRSIVIAAGLAAAVTATAAAAEPRQVTCSGQDQREDAQGRATTGRAYEVYYIDTDAGTVSRRFDGELVDLEDKGWDCDVSPDRASCSKRSTGIDATSDSIEIDLQSGEWSDTRYAAAWGPGQGFMPQVYSGRSEKTGSCRFY